ncbi:MAG: bifunctional folylpolyglutamate synthase/dihydrofolate synthase [Devosiaceae bacterium]|nr:bifunctional folylpolyglutamate synthase/dihydrofolate synthase [Devosiaceae bacterium]
MSETDLILARLLRLHPNKLIDLKLDRVERLLEKLGHPEKNLPPVIHVAGTNGKGSTIAHLRAFLEEAGKKVHVYNSPHLVRFNERIRLAGKLVSSETLNQALRTCERVNDAQPITYFEITTVAAFLLFNQVRADYLLLEVGLGGRFDATNVIPDPFGTIITPVSIDHVEFLGADIENIAREKAGIIKSGVPLVVGSQPDEVKAVIEAEATKLGVTALFADQDFMGLGERGRMTYQDENGLLDLPLSALEGEFQIQNAALAIAAVRYFELPVNDHQIEIGLGCVDWPGRLMHLKKGELVEMLAPNQQLWLDGGHNVAGGAVLAHALRLMSQRDRRPLVLVLGAYTNKDMAGYLQKFDPGKTRIFTLPLQGERASWDSFELAELAQKLGFAASPVENVQAAIAASSRINNARLVVCGSLHLAGEVLAQNKTPPD